MEQTKKPALALVATFLLALAACSPSADAPQDRAPTAARSPVPTQAQLDAFLAEGQEPTLQQFRPLDYWLHYKMMQATGIEQALGGEAQAIAALRALGNAYERKLRDLKADPPKIIPAAFTGEGMSSGLTGMGMGGFVAIIGSGVNGAVSSMSDEQLAELVSRGPIKAGGKGGSAEFRFDEHGGFDQTMEFEVSEEGLSGKVKVKTHMESCPDAEGKLTVTLDVDSSMSVTGKPGTGGYVRSHFTYERYLDDDARLIDTADGVASNLRIRIGGTENNQSQHVDITQGWERSGKSSFENHSESGFSIFRMGEVERVSQLLATAMSLNALIAEVLVRGIGFGQAPWEGGRCVKLDVTSNPSKRTGIKPNTAFDLEAKPRAKSDGAPARGTVTAALSGDASLLPAGGKVPADAKYSYAAPDKKDQTASIEFEARSKRGVARTTLEFDTKATRAYLAAGGLDDFHGTGTICDLAQPFTISGGGNTVTFTPSSEAGGSYSYQGNMAGFGVNGSGTYTASANESGGRIAASGNGCVQTKKGATCADGTELYTLTPAPPCDGPAQ